MTTFERAALACPERGTRRAGMARAALPWRPPAGAAIGANPSTAHTHTKTTATASLDIVPVIARQPPGSFLLFGTKIVFFDQFFFIFFVCALFLQKNCLLKPLRDQPGPPAMTAAGGHAWEHHQLFDRHDDWLSPWLSGDAPGDRRGGGGERPCAPPPRPRWAIFCGAQAAGPRLPGLPGLARWVLQRCVLPAAWARMPAPCAAPRTHFCGACCPFIRLRPTDR
jgi:hypothetical protein